MSEWQDPWLDEDLKYYRWSARIWRAIALILTGLFVFQVIWGMT